jgi:ribonuclease P protein component
LERLKKRREFLSVQKGRRVHTGLFSVQCLRRDDDRGPRVGFTVSKRVSLSAVERNRIRRRLKEAVRLEGAGTGAVDYVIVARIEAIAASFDSLRKEWRRASIKAASQLQDIRLGSGSDAEERRQ